MTEAELRGKYDLVKEQLFSGAVKSSVYRTFFSQARPVECNGKWYVAPVRFTDEEWKKKNYISDLVHRMNEKLDRPDFSLQGEVKVFQVKPFGYMIIGRDERTKFDHSKGIEKINVKLGDASKSKGTIPSFKEGTAVHLKINSQQKGWLFLFCIDATGVIDPVYPKKFGIKSDVWITTNSDFDYSRFANERRRENEIDEEWSFAGSVSGSERVFALVIDYPHDVFLDENFILEHYSFPLLFSHRKVPRGVEKIPEPRERKATNIKSIKKPNIVIGFADYYYEANGPS